MYQEKQTHKTGGGQPPPASSVKRWQRFFMAVVLLVVLIYSAPAAERIPVLGEKITALRESGINVGAWYYDDVEEYFEAEDYIRDKMERKAMDESRKDF